MAGNSVVVIAKHDRDLSRMENRAIADLMDLNQLQNSDAAKDVQKHVQDGRSRPRAKWYKSRRNNNLSL